jgi:hypothetical protein
MSEESATPPETSATPSAGSARRVSNPRPKKKAKSPKPEKSAEEIPAEPSAKFPEFPESSEPADAPRGDWPEPEAPSSGNAAASENTKRKRRRKKGKGGNNPQNAAPAVDAEDPAVSQPQRPQPSRVKLDPELLAKFAWKIYLAEVSEEGVALVSDNDAKELTRRCFRLAEIFLEEQSRRR